MNLFSKLRLEFTLRKRFRWVWQTLGIALPWPALRFDGPPDFPFDCMIERQGSAYSVQFGMADVALPQRIDSYLYWMTLCPREIAAMLVDLSDGDQPSRACFAMSARSPEVQVLPDSYFFSTRGFRRYRELSEDNPVPWDRRASVLRWRGTTTGYGRNDRLSADAADDPEVLPRIRLALLLKNAPLCDVGISSSTRGPELQRNLVALELWRDPIEETSWIGDKYALDIDGNTNTWSNFLARLHFGCCVLKVDSPLGYRQWYYERLRAWEHFVPVRSDLSDLVEKTDWVRSNDARAKEIAAAGQAFARSMTLESEAAWAVQAIAATDARLRVLPALA